MAASASLPFVFGPVGVRVGPKAAQVGKLTRYFPGQVAPGLAVPFGLFSHALMERETEPGGPSLFDWMTARFDEMERIREVFNDSGIVLRQTAKTPPREVFRNRMARTLYEAVNGERTVAEILLHAHGSEYSVTKFLFELHRIIQRPLMGQNALFHGSDENNRKLEPFGAMQRHQRNGVARELRVLVLALVALGDHQPAPLVTGEEAPRTVPVHIVATDEGLIERPVAVGRVKPSQLDELLHPMVDPDAEHAAQPLAKGLPAGPGGGVRPRGRSV